MNDEPEPEHDEPALGGPLGAPDAEDFDDPGHTWVRELLADARATSPVPDDVAARLEETLAGLQAERASAQVDSGSTSATDSGAQSVVPLRHRLRPRLAAAAAAVIVLGAGGVAVAQLGGNGSSGSDSASSGSAADSAGSAAAASPKATGSVSAAEPQALSGSGSAVPRLTTASFAADAAQVMRQVAALDTAAGSTDSFDAASPSAPAQTPGQVAPEASATSLGSTGPLQAPPVTATPPEVTKDVRGAAACTGPSVSDGVTLQAILDGTPVALVFRAPTATGQRVEAWSCDGSTLLRSAVIAH